MRSARILGVLASTVLLGACFDDASSISTDVASLDVRMGYQMSGTAQGTQVKGYLHGPGANTRLVEGDRLELRTPLGPVPLQILDGEFTFDLPPAGGDFELALLRPPGRGGDLTQKQWLAPPFAVRAPATASRAAPLTVTWDPAVGPHRVRLSVKGACVAPITRDLASDVGSYGFNAYELASSAAAPGTCTVTIEIVKGADLKTSYVASTQTASTTLEMTP
jgi:hypothetical protein